MRNDQREDRKEKAETVKIRAIPKGKLPLTVRCVA